MPAGVEVLDASMTSAMMVLEGGASKPVASSAGAARIAKIAPQNEDNSPLSRGDNTLEDGDGRAEDGEALDGRVETMAMYLIVATYTRRRGRSVNGLVWQR